MAARKKKITDEWKVERVGKLDSLISSTEKVIKKMVKEKSEDKREIGQLKMKISQWKSEKNFLK